jgi:hypothetical protein
VLVNNKEHVAPSVKMFLIFRSIDFISLKNIVGGNSEKIEIFQNRYFSGATITNVTGRFFAKK